MADSVTIQDLIDHLIQYREVAGPDTEVRLATQPSWPFENNLKSIGLSRPTEDKPSVVYLGEGRQLDYLPSEAKEALGWD